MKEEIYDRSVKTGELQLVGLSRKIDHYGGVLLALFLAAAALIFNITNYLSGNENIFESKSIWLPIILLVVAFIVYRIQKWQLRFIVVKTKLDGVQLKGILLELADELKWEVTSSATYSFTAKTKSGFLSSGERVTVLFYQDSVFINSIGKGRRQIAMDTWQRNRQNEQALIEKIKEVEGI